MGGRTSWVAVEVYGGYATDTGDPEKTEKFDNGVMMGTLGILIQSVVGLFSSYALNYLNKYGVMTIYRIGALSYGLLAIATWWGRSVVASLVIQGLIGLVYPIINVNPYIVLARYDEEEQQEIEAKEAEDEEGNEAESDEKTAEDPVGDQQKIEGEKSDSDAVEDTESFHAAHTAIMNMSMTFAQILVGSISGLIAEVFGDITVVFVITGAMLVLASVVIGAVDYWYYKKQQALEGEYAEIGEEEETYPTDLEAQKTALLYGNIPSPHVLSVSRSLPGSVRASRRTRTRPEGRILRRRTRSAEHVRRPRAPSPRTNYLRQVARHRNRNIVKHLIRSRFYSGVLATSERSSRIHHAIERRAHLRSPIPQFVLSTSLPFRGVFAGLDAPSSPPKANQQNVRK